MLFRRAQLQGGIKAVGDNRQARHRAQLLRQHGGGAAGIQKHRLAWLQQLGHSEASAREALEAARGHPGQADNWLREDGLSLRREVGRDLEQLAAGKTGAVELAQKWCGDDNAALRLRFAADLALAQASTDALTTPERLHKLAAWFDAANRTRDLLRTTVRADLAVVELLLAWNKVNERPAARGNR